MLDTGTSKAAPSVFQVTSRQSRLLAVTIVSVVLCCLLFYVSEYRVEWPGSEKIRQGQGHGESHDHRQGQGQNNLQGLNVTRLRELLVTSTQKPKENDQGKREADTSVFNQSYISVDKYSVNNDHLEVFGTLKVADMEIPSHKIVIGGLSNLVNQIKHNATHDEKFAGARFENEQLFNVGRTVTEINCKAITHGEEFELKKADLLYNVSRTILQPEDYITMTKDCSKFISDRGYITDFLTELERDFPIAFSLLMYKDVEQAERLLRAIYRPQNFYCIHVDAKSDESIYSAVQGVASCFENVHVLATRVDVQWGYFSVLEPELLCMEHLWNRSAAWRYFINLTGQEFPLRTNYELVRILQAYKGANDVEGTVKRYSPCVFVNYRLEAFTK